MTINPNDPWYPCSYSPDEHPGVTARLKLAVEMMKSPYLETIRQTPQGSAPQMSLVDVAFLLADTVIDRANHDEGSDDGK